MDLAWLVTKDDTASFNAELKPVDDDPKSPYVPNPDMSAYIKWDGCCHLYLHGLDDDDVEYWHVDDLDDLIKQLTWLRDHAKAKFQNQYWVK